MNYEKAVSFKELKIEDLVSWVKIQAQKRNKSAILIEVDGTIACMVNIFIAKKTGLPVHAIVNCNDKNWQVQRDFCESVNVDYTRVSYGIDLENFMPEIDDYQDNRIIYKNNQDLLEATQKTARISYIAETTNSLMISNITRDDYLFVRNYPNINHWDIMPFADLSMAMVNNLFDKLVLTKTREIEAFCQLSPKPNLEIEWIYNANEKSRTMPGSTSSVGLGPSIIESESDPTKHLKWYTYTTSQKALIAKVHQIEKTTRYKENTNIPIFHLEELDD